MTVASKMWDGSPEARLSDFAPDFEFEPAPPLPEEEFADRLRRLVGTRREGKWLNDHLDWLRDQETMPKQ